MYRFYDVGLLLKLLLVLFLFVGCGGSSEPTPTPQPEIVLSPAQAHGKELFGQLPGNCATCHSLQAHVLIVGPSLNGVASRAESRVVGLDARQYLEESILKPDAYTVEGFGDLMPRDLGKKLTTAELNDLIEFLLTLK